MGTTKAEAVNVFETQFQFLSFITALKIPIKMYRNIPFYTFFCTFSEQICINLKTANSGLTTISSTSIKKAAKEAEEKAQKAAQEAAQEAKVFSEKLNEFKIKK